MMASEDVGTRPCNSNQALKTAELEVKQGRMQSLIRL